MIRCSACGVEVHVDADTCAACGALTRTVDVKVMPGVVRPAAAVVERPTGKVLGRHGRRGQVRPFYERTVKHEFDCDLGLVLEVERLFDHDAGTYAETYRDPDGEVTYSICEPITDQSAHGPRGRR